MTRLKARLRRLLVPVDDGHELVAAAPIVALREICARFWPDARPYRKQILGRGAVPAEPALARLRACSGALPPHARPQATRRLALAADERHPGDQAFLLAGVGNAISALARIVLFGGALLYLQWQLALASLVVGSLFYVAARRFSLLVKHAAREKRRHSGSLSAVAEESLGNAALVQSLNRQADEVDRFRREMSGSSRPSSPRPGSRGVLPGRRPDRAARRDPGHRPRHLGAHAR